MRYQSFYPFARQSHPSQPFMQQNIHSNLFTGPPPMEQMGALFQRPQAPNHGPQTFGQGAGFGRSALGQGASPLGQGGSKMESYMQTANQFLNTAQQFAPLVQQISPMLQNIPAMWRLYKGFQSLPSASSAPAAASTAASATRAASQGISTPRIFQPPS